MVHRSWLLVPLAIIIVLFTLMVVGELRVAYGVTWIILLFSTFFSINGNNSDDKEEIFTMSFFTLLTVLTFTIALYFISQDLVKTHLIFFIGNIASVILSWALSILLIPDYSLPKKKKSEGEEITPNLDIF